MDRNPAKTTCTITPLLRSYLRLCYFLGVDSTKYDGAEILEKVLAPQDFHFQFREIQPMAKASGGASAG